MDCGLIVLPSCEIRIPAREFGVSTVHLMRSVCAITFWASLIKSSFVKSDGSSRVY